MARDKVLGTARLRLPLKQQDGRPFAATVVAIIEPIVTPITNVLTSILNQLVRVGDGLEVHTAEVGLEAGQHGGRVVLEVDVDPAYIGGPVLVTMQAGEPFDEAEFGVVSFVGRVVDERRLELAWSSLTPAPASARIAFILGRL